MHMTPLLFSDFKNSSEAHTPSSLSSFSCFWIFVTATPVHCAALEDLASPAYAFERGMILVTETLRTHSTADLQDCVDPVLAISECAKSMA